VVVVVVAAAVAVAVVMGAITGSGGGEAVVSRSAEQNEQALHLQYWQSASRVR
jgi:hypothetical protein